MAALTITVTSTVRCFGVAPSNKWNAYNWNAFIWGEGTADLPVVFGKLITNAQASDTALTKQPYKLISESISSSGETSSERLRDGAGYSYVFPNNTTDAEERDIPSWAAGAAGSTSWSSQAVTTTAWSDA